MDRKRLLQYLKADGWICTLYLVVLFSVVLFIRWEGKYTIMADMTGVAFGVILPPLMSLFSLFCIGRACVVIRCVGCCGVLGDVLVGPSRIVTEMVWGLGLGLGLGIGMDWLGSYGSHARITGINDERL